MAYERVCDAEHTGSEGVACGMVPLVREDVVEIRHMVDWSIFPCSHCEGIQWTTLCGGLQETSECPPRVPHSTLSSLTLLLYPSILLPLLPQSPSFHSFLSQTAS